MMQARAIQTAALGAVLLTASSLSAQYYGGGGGGRIDDRGGNTPGRGEAGVNPHGGRATPVDVSTPGPSAPSAPRAPGGGSITPRSAPGPITPGAQPARGSTTGGARGTPLVFTPGATARHRARVSWDAFAVVGEEALDPETAAREIAAADPRPILLRRQCGDACARCRTLAKIADSEDESLGLMMRWFHTVAVDARVAQPAHPLNKLFAAQNHPHLLVVKASGADARALDSVSAPRLRGDLIGYVKLCYAKDPEQSLTRLATLMRRYDALEEQRSELLTRYRRSSDGSAKEKDINTKLDAIERELQDIARAEREAADLGLAVAKAAPAAVLPRVAAIESTGSRTPVAGDSERPATMPEAEALTYDVLDFLAEADPRVIAGGLALVGGPSLWHLLPKAFEQQR